MARKTDGEKVDDLTNQFNRLSAAMEERSRQFLLTQEQLRAEIATLRDDIKRLTDRNAATEAKNAALEERCKALEKGTDRNWQFWLALLAAGVAIVIAVVKR